MKRILPLLLTLCCVPRANAAPTAPAVKAPAKTDPANVDPAAKALLDKAAKAYEALNSFSMDYTLISQGEEARSTGKLAFLRPDKARGEIVAGPERLTVVADGKKIWLPLGNKSYRDIPMSGPDAISTVMSVTGSSLSLPLSTLVNGKSMFEIELFVWDKVTVLPDNGVKLDGHLNLGKMQMATVTNLYFDPTDSLIRRVENTTTFRGKTRLEIAIVSNLQLNPDLPADQFVFVPAPGSKPYVEPKRYDPKIAVGKAPFALKGKDLQGKTHSWSEFKGKVVLLDFWATWCGPCIGELPNVLKNYSTYHPKGFEIVGVSLDQDKKALTDFIKAKNLKYVNLFDGKGWKNIDAGTYGVQAIPFTLLIGKDGKIAAINPRGEALEPAIKAALAKR
ncbi:redoxin domain-containing protein [bacterium]|nr:MAG: redoxin domain-containing protein [bacterium]